MANSSVHLPQPATPVARGVLRLVVFVALFTALTALVALVG